MTLFIIYLLFFLHGDFIYHLFRTYPFSFQVIKMQRSHECEHWQRTLFYCVQSGNLVLQKENYRIHFHSFFIAEVCVSKCWDGVAVLLVLVGQYESQDGQKRAVTFIHGEGLECCGWQANLYVHCISIFLSNVQSCITDTGDAASIREQREGK